MLVLERQQGIAVVVQKDLQKQWTAVTNFLLVFLKRILSKINYTQLVQQIKTTAATGP
jgi:hypothetical protein